jgi:wyosine [tRNA(Phe)-imidazoG37] synthetase (radical SAM superfamily)
MRLTTRDHDRGNAGMTYVYSVVSRRARGVSIGVNLNPNDACNWRCVYCQVPGLVAGAAPPIDVPELASELREVLALARDERWMERHVPEGSRRLVDVAISGNGEPTSSRELGPVLDAIRAELEHAELLGRLRVVLITNGSLVHLEHVGPALRKLAALGGEVWFKLDAATASGLERVNSAHTSVERAKRNLAAAAHLCPTWIQTIALRFDGEPTLGPDEERSYVGLVRSVLADGAPLRGIRLYGLARESHQPEASRLAPLATEEIEALGRRLASATGLEVLVDP